MAQIVPYDPDHDVVFTVFVNAALIIYEGGPKSTRPDIKMAKTSLYHTIY